MACFGRCRANRCGNTDYDVAMTIVRAATDENEEHSCCCCCCCGCGCNGNVGGTNDSCNSCGPCYYVTNCDCVCDGVGSINSSDPCGCGGCGNNTSDNWDWTHSCGCNNHARNCGCRG